MKPAATVLLALALAGCASTYSLTLMPRTSGQLYYGEATSRPGEEAQVSITIGERTYRGTWVVTQPAPQTGFVVGGVFGRRPGIGTSVVIDNPAGTEAKALLRAADGSGLRCDLKGVHAGAGGSGTCQDDQGLVYDVQMRVKGRS